MAFHYAEYQAEMDRMEARWRESGVSVTAYAGLAIVESPLAPADRFIVDRKNRTIITRSKNYLMWRIELRQARIDARADLDAIIAAAWKRIGVDSSTTSK